MMHPVSWPLEITRSYLAAAIAANESVYFIENKIDV